MRPSIRSILWLQPLLHFAAAITVDPTSKSSLAAGAKTALDGMLSFYHGQQVGGIPGIFNQAEGYYWWIAGAAWNAVMQYWWLTNDTSYNDLVMTAMMFQVGDNNDFMPANQTHSEGNDDQAFWGLAAIAAAEMTFPNPPAKKPQWLALAQAVFNEQIARWDPQNCGGGLRWQIFPFNSGYDYKNSISNGCLFHLAARLARYTGNQTYMTYAERSFEWISTVGLLSPDWSVYDGLTITNCSNFNHIEWTYNNGHLLVGAAYLYNFTNGDATWKSRIDSLLAAAQAKFFTNGILYEPACETGFTCNIDQMNFKGFLAQYLALVTRMAPYTTQTVNALLATSASAAASHCNAGTNGTMCTMWWTVSDGPATFGVGQQMSALNVFNANLMKFVTSSAQVVTSSSGGTSQGNPNAGNSNSDSVYSYPYYYGCADYRITPATTGDRILAGVLTSLVSVGGIGFAAWLAI